MARPAPPERLPEIAAAATKVFGLVGYRRARTADVAALAGISTGGLFTYVDSKEALFHLVFVAGFGELDGPRTALPLRAPTFDETLDLVSRGLGTAMAGPRLRAAARVDDPDDVRAELAGVIEEQYRATSRTWPLLAVIERCATDLPALEDMYFNQGRRRRLQLLERYLARRVASGQLRATVDTAVVARWLLETVTWFGWHRREDRDAALYDDERALVAITQLICDALVEPST